MNRLLVAGCLILVLISSLLAEAKWTKVEMPDFTLVGTASEKEIKDVGFKLERFRQTLSIVFPNAKLESSLPTFVYVFSSKEEIQSYSSRAKIPIVPAGFYFQTAEANYITISPEKNDNYHTYYHEYFHYVLGRNLRTIPLWLNEGMAEYFGTFEPDDIDAKAKLGIPAMLRLQEIRKGDFMSLEHLFAVNHNSPEYRENTKAGLFYAESWALVHFFLNGNNGQRQTQFYHFINLLNRGVEAKTAFEQSFQTDYKSIENDLLNYIHHFAFPVAEIDLKATSAANENNVKVSKLSEAEAKIFLGDLMRYVNSNEEAEKMLQQAISVEPNSSDAYRLLGNVEEAQKNFTEARKNFEKALSLDAGNYLNYYYLARYLEQDKNYEEAIKYYQQAIKLKSDVPRVYAMLGHLEESLSRNDEAISAYNNALQLNPSLEVNYFNLAKIAFKIEKNDLAQSSAQSIIEMNNWTNNYSPRAALILYFVYQRENKTGDAAEILKLGKENINRDNFYYAVFRYLNKEIDDKALFSLAQNKNDQTIAVSYTGLNLLTQGKTMEAKEKFEQVKNNGNPEFVEYDYAVNELKKLSQN